MLCHFKQQKRKRYTTVDNQIIENPTLSWKAKGILIYLLSRPEDWQVYVKDLINRASDGEKALRSGLKELEENFYLTRVIERDEKGQFVRTVYFVYEDYQENPLYLINKPIIQVNGEMDKIEEFNPVCQKRQVEKPHVENEVYINTKYKNTDLTKKEFKEEEEKEELPQNFNKFLNWLRDVRKGQIKDLYFWEKRVKQNFLNKDDKTLENYQDFILSHKNIIELEEFIQKYMNIEFVDTIKDEFKELKILEVGETKNFKDLKNSSAKFYIKITDKEYLHQKFLLFNDIEQAKSYINERRI